MKTPLLLSAIACAIAGCTPPPDDDAPQPPVAPAQPGPAGEAEAPAPPPAPADAAPAPGTPDAEGPAGPPDGHGLCPWAGIEDTWKQYDDSERIRLSGQLRYDGGEEGKAEVLLDFLDDERDALLSARCSAAGPFAVEVPQGLGEVTLVAVRDGDWNGPTINDAVGMAEGPLVIGTEDISDVEIPLTVGADLGDLRLPRPDEVPSHPPVDDVDAPGPPTPPEGEVSGEEVIVDNPYRSKAAP